MAKIENRTSVMPSTARLLESGVVGVVDVVGVVGSWELGALELEGLRARRAQDCSKDRGYLQCRRIRGRTGRKIQDGKEHAYFCHAQKAIVAWSAACLPACLPACVSRTVLVPACPACLVGCQLVIEILGGGRSNHQSSMCLSRNTSQNSARCSTPSGCSILQPRKAEHGGTEAAPIGAQLALSRPSGRVWMRSHHSAL